MKPSSRFEVKGKKEKGKSDRQSSITNHQSPIIRLFLIAIPILVPILAIASGSLAPIQAQSNTALTIRADVQEANSITGVVTATGNVKMSYPARQIDAVAEQAQYFSKEQRVVLTGNVIVTQEGVNSIKAQTVTYLVTEGKFVALPPNNQQVETIYVVPDRDAVSNPATSATPVTQIKPAFKKQQVSPTLPTTDKLQQKPQEIIPDGK